MATVHTNPGEMNDLKKWLEERLHDYNELITESNEEYASGVTSKEHWLSAVAYWQRRICCDTEVYNQRARETANQTYTPSCK